MSNIQICGHRGVAAWAPENTLAGIALARELCVGLVEVDLRLTRDGQVVVFHDAKLGRTAPGHGRVGEYEWDHLRELDAGAWFAPEFANQRIPTLEELLQAGGDDLLWNLELKIDDPGDVPGGNRLIKAVMETLVAREMAHRVLLTSFDHNLIRRVMDLMGAPRCGFISGKKSQVEILPGERVAVHSLRHNLITADLVTRAHALGREVHAWTVNKAEVLARMVALDVDVVISDDPGRMLGLTGRGSQ